MWMTREVLNSFQKKVHGIERSKCPTWYLQFHSFGFLQVTHQYTSLQELASWTNSALKQIFQLNFLWFILGIFHSSNFRGKDHGHRVHWKNRSMEWWGSPKLSFSRAWKISFHLVSSLGRSTKCAFFPAWEKPKTRIWHWLPRNEIMEFHGRDLGFSFGFTWIFMDGTRDQPH